MTTRRPPEEQLADLEKREEQLKARIQKKRAEVAGKTRKEDTRRKIMALEHAEQDKQFGATLRRLLKEHVTRPADRKLFDL
mgnify:CR=1 FL=1